MDGGGTEESLENSSDHESNSREAVDLSDRIGDEIEQANRDHTKAVGRVSKKPLVTSMDLSPLYFNSELKHANFTIKFGLKKLLIPRRNNMNFISIGDALDVSSLDKEIIDLYKSNADRELIKDRYMHRMPHKEESKPILAMDEEIINAASELEQTLQEADIGQALTRHKEAAFYIELVGIKHVEHNEAIHKELRVIQLYFNQGKTLLNTGKDVRLLSFQNLENCKLLQGTPEPAVIV